MTLKNSDPAFPSLTRRLFRRPGFRLALLVGLSLALIPTLLSRKALAKRAHELASPAAPKGPAPAPTPKRPKSGGSERQGSIQALVDALRARLGIPNVVVVSLVRSERLVVSVERMRGQDGAFSLSIEEGFLEGLSEEEIAAIVAHELGHVWIFTHHPFLHTEELANDIAMQAVSRETLEEVYAKVWKYTGEKGTLAYLSTK